MQKTKALMIFISFICFINLISLSYANEKEVVIEELSQKHIVSVFEDNYCILKYSLTIPRYAIADPQKGELLTPFYFDEITPLLPVNALKVKLKNYGKSGKYGIYDLNQKRISKIKYDDIRISQKNNKYFFEYKDEDKWKKLRGVHIKNQKSRTTVGLAPNFIINTSDWISYSSISEWNITDLLEKQYTEKYKNRP